MQDEQPVVKVVKGEPTPEELAALVTAIKTRVGQGGGQAGTSDTQLSAWGAYWHRLRQAAPPGSGHHGWRASALPH